MHIQMKKSQKLVEKKTEKCKFQKKKKLQTIVKKRQKCKFK